jgi:hypothetical protein
MQARNKERKKIENINFVSFLGHPNKRSHAVTAFFEVHVHDARGGDERKKRIARVIKLDIINSSNANNHRGSRV